MTSQALSTAHLDYLQRSTAPPASLAPTPSRLTAPPELRRWVRIAGVGRAQKEPSQPPVLDRPIRLPTEDLLAGLYGYGIPVAFEVAGSPSSVAFHLGVWSPAERERAAPAVLDARLGVLKAVLSGLYLSIDLASPDPPPPNGALWPLSGLALGIPTAKTPDPSDPALPLDRLVRALSGTSWSVLVLAEPVPEPVTRDVRLSVVNEMRAVQTDAQSMLVPSPLAKLYTEMLEVGLAALTQGQATGAWRTAVYLGGEPAAYYRLASVWRSVYSGERSLPEPVRVWDLPQVATLASEWSMPDLPGEDGPGLYRRPYAYQTLLTSSQLAAYIHLPQMETGGFTVRLVPDFDPVPPTATQPALAVGHVVHRGLATGATYLAGTRALTRHAFVAGVTGSGKTNTVFHLLHSASEQGVPFLVLEPAKTEYRALLDHPALRGLLLVFTPGEERVSPLRLNPFEVVGWPKTSVGVHLDLLRQAFSAGFGMWTPLPQVLEQCLHETYRDRGWDITANTNARLEEAADLPGAWPTLTDLAAKVDEVVPRLGYDERVTSDLRAALRTRIEGLRTGGKGRMLDVQRSVPMSVLLEHPVVLELEGMGDDDDKAFLMALLLIRTVEQRRAEGESPELRHLLVIEEAHRLLANVSPRTSEEQADPRGQAVESFNNLLSEIRAYGQGVIVADQIPVRLSPQVIKNTNLKIAHRVVATDDRETLAGTMAMNERQAVALTTLGVGQAAVFGEGDDAPVLVQVPPAKGDGVGRIPPARVAEEMARAKALAPHRALFRPLQKEVDVDVQDERAWEAARRIVGTAAFQRSFARLVLSTLEDAEALERLWPDVTAQVQARRPLTVNEQDLLRCVVLYAAEWLAHRRGAQASWFYRETQDLADRLQGLLLAKVSAAATAEKCESFRALALKLHQRRFDPFPACSRICREQPPRCLYRFAAADWIADGDSARSWSAAFHPVTRQTWEKSMDAGYALIQFAAEDWPTVKLEAADAAARRASLCFGQQMLMQQLATSPHEARFWIGKLIAESGH